MADQGSPSSANRQAAPGFKIELPGLKGPSLASGSPGSGRAHSHTVHHGIPSGPSPSTSPLPFSLQRPRARSDGAMQKRRYGHMSKYKKTFYVDAPGSPMSVGDDSAEMDPLLRSTPASPSAAAQLIHSDRTQKQLSFVLVEKNEIVKWFHYPLVAASEGLSISCTLLKRVCRKLNIRRWPFRKVNALQRKLHQFAVKVSQHDPELQTLMEENDRNPPKPQYVAAEASTSENRDSTASPANVASPGNQGGPYCNAEFHDRWSAIMDALERIDQRGMNCFTVDLNNPGAERSHSGFAGASVSTIDGADNASHYVTLPFGTRVRIVEHPSSAGMTANDYKDLISVMGDLNHLNLLQFYERLAPVPRNVMALFYVHQNEKPGDTLLPSSTDTGSTCGTETEDTVDSVSTSGPGTPHAASPHPRVSYSGRPSMQYLGGKSPAEYSAGQSAGNSPSVSVNHMAGEEPSNAAQNPEFDLFHLLNKLQVQLQDPMELQKAVQHLSQQPPSARVNQTYSLLKTLVAYSQQDQQGEYGRHGPYDEGALMSDNAAPLIQVPGNSSTVQHYPPQQSSGNTQQAPAGPPDQAALSASSAVFAAAGFQPLRSQGGDEYNSAANPQSGSALTSEALSMWNSVLSNPQNAGNPAERVNVPDYRASGATSPPLSMNFRNLIPHLDEALNSQDVDSAEFLEIADRVSDGDCPMTQDFLGMNMNKPLSLHGNTTSTQSPFGGLASNSRQANHLDMLRDGSSSDFD